MWTLSEFKNFLTKNSKKCTNLSMVHLILMRNIISVSIRMTVSSLSPLNHRSDHRNQTVSPYLTWKGFLNMKQPQKKIMSLRKIRVVHSMRKLLCKMKNRIIWHPCSILMTFIRNITRVQLIQSSIPKMLLMIEFIINNHNIK